jgi:phosphoribosylaminoimidazole-succinocarboxamide synthase
MLFIDGRTTVNSMRLLRQGKVKDVYEMDDGNILFHFSDRVSAFDVKMATPIPRKGEVLCKFGKFWFEHLGTSHHMIRLLENDKMVVKRLTMLPVECVVRGYFYGSFAERYQNFLGSGLPDDYKPVLAEKLPGPIFDPTTKSEDHDVPISRINAIKSNLLSADEYDYLHDLSTKLYLNMSNIVERAGFIMADVKFEFGRDEAGNILLGDSLGPDEYRLWLKKEYEPGKLQESYDKQLLRDWLVRTGFKEKVDMLAKEGKKPASPEVDQEVVNELSRRYIFAYEQISGLKF